MSALPISLSQLLGQSITRPVIRINQAEGTIVVIAQDADAWQTEEGVFRDKADGKIVGATFKFDGEAGYSLEIQS